MMGQNEHPHPYSLKDRGEPEIITSIRVLIRIGMNWSRVKQRQQQSGMHTQACVEVVRYVRRRTYR